MAEAYGVWAAPITDASGQDTVDKFGEITDLEEVYSEGNSRDFCDGQTSPAPPRWADDDMSIIWSYSREGAELMSQFLRNGMMEDIAAGDLAQAPAWASNFGAMGYSPMEVGRFIESTRVLVEGLPELEALNDGQLESRMRRYTLQTGKLRPTPQEFRDWLFEGLED